VQVRQKAPLLRVGIDVGGTFTDLAAIDTQTGEHIVVKCPTTPRAPEEAVLHALDQLFEKFPQTPRIQYIAHSTTIATNALLGQMHLELPRVVFVTTEGFRDVVEIGRQNRSEVYNLFVTRPKPLAARADRVEARERIDYRGNVLLPLSDTEITRVVDEVRARKPDTIAIGLLHSYINDTHEQRLASGLRAALPDVPITCSADVDPEYREYERFSTALVNAALLPIVQRYIDRLQAQLRARSIDAPLFVMQSNGGMAAAKYASLWPAAIIESGPASGVIASAHLARTADAARVLSFDMGGTTAKAGTIVDGAVQVATEFEAAGTTHSGRSVKGSGYPVRFPFVDLAEISAGGGTIAWIDEAGALRVGPISAGADPGPACYGRSHHATVTDANLLLGRLNPRALAGGTFPIDAQRAREAIGALAERIKLSIEATAEGIVRIVDAQMAKVLRIVTVERGLDPRDFAMVAFGGNGPLHACALAEELDIGRIIVPPDPGVFSAYGLLVAELRASFVRPVLRETSALTDEVIASLFDELEALGRRALREQGGTADRMQFVREYDARYRGQSFELEVPHTEKVTVLANAFHEQHKRRYGYDVPEEPVEIVNARLTAVAGLEPVRFASPLANGVPRSPHHEERQVWIGGAYVSTPVYQREHVTENSMVRGPALIEQYDACTYVAPQWIARHRSALLLLERTND
jgi:N-methylhydantoinase A